MSSPTSLIIEACAHSMWALSTATLGMLLGSKPPVQNQKGIPYPSAARIDFLKTTAGFFGVGIVVQVLVHKLVKWAESPLLHWAFVGFSIPVMLYQAIWCGATIKEWLYFHSRGQSTNLYDNFVDELIYSTHMTLGDVPRYPILYWFVGLWTCGGACVAYVIAQLVAKHL